MDTMNICPGCGKPVASNAPDGLCPECLIKAGFSTGTEPGNPGPGSGFIPPAVDELRKLFPQLEILELIGKGGMGAVYKARQPALDRLVALKILPPGAADDPGFAERFNREARALARLSHPHIVAVHDFGQVGGQPYLVMEFVDGPNLRQVEQAGRLTPEQAGRLTPEQALAIVPQICEALQFAHNEGVVHRDIKPENILLDKKGRVKITDFGIAKIVGVPSGKTGLTGAKDVLGTPHYMAPEQVEKPSTVDHRADIYSLGVVFYELLTGELPLGKFQPPSKKVQVDVRLDEVVLHALEKEPERRYQQASQVKTDVDAIAAKAPLQGPTSPAADLERGRWLIVARAVIMCLAGGVFGIHLWPPLGITAMSWGIAGCVFVLWKSFGRDRSQSEDLAALKLANQAGLVHAIGILAVGLILAIFNSGLDQHWNAFLASLFGVGIGTSLFRLLKSLRPTQQPNKGQDNVETITGAPFQTSRSNSLEAMIVFAGTVIFVFLLAVVMELSRSGRIPLQETLISICILGLGICALCWAGVWPFPSPFPEPNFSSRNLRRFSSRWLPVAYALFLAGTAGAWLFTVLFGHIEQARIFTLATLGLATIAGYLSWRHWLGKGVVLGSCLVLVVHVLNAPDNQHPLAGLRHSERPSISWGPINERTLNDLDERRGTEALSFASGSALSLPADFSKQSSEAREAWLDSNRVDLLVDWANDRWALMTRGMQFRDVPNEQWSDPDLGWGGAWPDSEVLEKREGRSETFYLLPTNARPPLTFAILTSSGELGLLQITGLFTNAPRGMKLRYKLAQGGGGGNVVGQTTERVLYSVAVQRPIKGEDLDSSSQIEVPAELEKAGEDQFFHWLAASGVDLMAFAHKRAWALWASPRLVTVPSTLWEDTDFTQVRSALQSGEPGLTQVEPDVKEGFVSYHLPTNTPLPLTLAFETRTGAVGLLQVTGFTDSPQGISIRYKLAPVETGARQSKLQAGQNKQRKFVRLVAAENALTLEGQPTNWDNVGSLLARVPDRSNTVLELAVTSDQITVAQQNEWLQKATAFARLHGFEYASFIGIHPLGSKGTSKSANETRRRDDQNVRAG